MKQIEIEMRGPLMESDYHRLDEWLGQHARLVEDKRRVFDIDADGDDYFQKRYGF